MAKQPGVDKAEEITMAEPPEPPVQVRVRDWAADQAARVGYETAMAFVAHYPADTGVAAELEQALALFQQRPV